MAIRTPRLSIALRRCAFATTLMGTCFGVAWTRSERVRQERIRPSTEGPGLLAGIPVDARLDPPRVGSTRSHHARSAHPLAGMTVLDPRSLVGGVGPGVARLVLGRSGPLLVREVALNPRCLEVGVGLVGAWLVLGQSHSRRGSLPRPHRRPSLIFELMSRSR